MMEIYDGNPRGRRAVDVSITFTTLALFFVTLRLYTRFSIIRYAGLEDYIVILATFCSVAFTVCIALQAKWGVGRSITDIPEDHVPQALKAVWASVLVDYLNLGLIKAAILLQYRRAFYTRQIGKICWILLALNGLFTLWTILGMIFVCSPVHAFWTLEPARCIDQDKMWIANAAVNVFGNVILAIFPMALIGRLDISKWQKRALIGNFAIGVFICLASILCLASIIAVANNEDTTYNDPAAAIWSAIETNVGLICACLPLLRPLITKWFPGMFIDKHDACAGSRQSENTLNTASQRGIWSRNAGGFEGTVGDEETDVVEVEEKGIQVVTHIQIDVEGGQGRLSGWMTRMSMSSRRENRAQQLD